MPAKDFLASFINISFSLLTGFLESLAFSLDIYYVTSSSSSLTSLLM
jgi:hypothetical protein